MKRLESPKQVKTLIMASAVVLAMMAVWQGVLWYETWKVENFTMLPSDAQFLAWFSVPFLYLMMTVLLYALFAMAYTVIEFDQKTLRLKQPFNQWTGTWSGVRKAFYLNKGLHFQVTDSIWSLWAIRVDTKVDSLLEEIKDKLPEGAWMEEQAAKRYLRQKTIPPLIIIVFLLMLLIPLLYILI